MTDLFAFDQLEAVFAAREDDVRAFLPEPERFARLRREAAALAAAYPEVIIRPPLYGWTLGVKNIFHVAGFVTRAGTDFLALAREAQAPAVTRLLDAGALVAGKTVTTEFAYFAPGPTRNPHNIEHTPGGSSSGSAAAVAAGLCRVALGTQTIGSVNRPAAYCGVVGYKPSYGRVPTDGVIPLAPSVDTVGCFTADVADMRQVARALLGDEWRMIKLAAEKPVLGVPLGRYLDHTDVTGMAHYRRVIDHLNTAGYTIQQVAVMPDFDAIAERHKRLVAAEAARVHADWFAAYGAHYHPKTAALIRQGQNINDGALAEAVAGRARLREYLTGPMDAHGINLWIAPPAPGTAPRGLDSTGDPIMNLPWTHAGLPTLTLPAGCSSNGLPLGVQVIGRWQEDEALLAWADDLAEALAGLAGFAGQS